MIAEKHTIAHELIQLLQPLEIFFQSLYIHLHGSSFSDKLFSVCQRVLQYLQDEIFHVKFVQVDPLYINLHHSCYGDPSHKSDDIDR